MPRACGLGLRVEGVGWGFRGCFFGLGRFIWGDGSEDILGGCRSCLAFVWVLGSTAS